MVRMTIILPHPLFSRDSGNLRTLELLMHKPDDFQVTIVEARHPTPIKQDNVDLLNSLNGVKLVSVKSLDQKIYSLSLKPPLSTLLLWLIKPQIIYLERLTNSKRLNFLGEEDIIYVFDNTYSKLIPSTKAFILGSNHAFVYERIPRSEIRELFTRFVAKLTLLGILNHRIGGYHLFPGMLELIEVRPKKSITLPLGIITAAYHIEKRSGKPRFLYAAQLKEGKGILTVIEAWKLSRLGSTATLEICGWGVLVDYLKSLKLEGVIVHGYVTDKDLREIYSRSDVFVYPTSGDNYGFTILEALASGLKVLTSKILKGLFDDYESACSLEYLDTDAAKYAEKMIELAHSIEKVRANAWNTRNLTIKLNDIEVISKNFFDFCRSVSFSRTKTI